MTESCENLRKDFLEQLEKKDIEVQDLHHEIAVLHDFIKVYQSEAKAMKLHYEFMMKVVAKEAWDYVDNLHSESFSSESFEKWYSRRSLTIGDV